jgi:hypothetical protein
LIVRRNEEKVKEAREKEEEEDLGHSERNPAFTPSQQMSMMSIF